MEYKVLKLVFTTPLHIGINRLIDAEYTISADTIFSALVHEYIKINGDDNLEYFINQFRNDNIILSNAFPFIDNDYYIPKPIINISGNAEDSTNKKQFKKLEYISFDLLDDYLDGVLDAGLELENFKLGSSNFQTKLNHQEDPYSVGSYSFKNKNGLYIIVGFKNIEDYNNLYKLFKYLQYTGIGGRKTSGYGEFKLYEDEEFDYEYLSRNTSNYLLINTAMAKEDELENALNDANYLLQKRSGFVVSNIYSDTNLRKKDFYSFKAGSVFTNKFIGDIFDVSNNGNHPVYRYAKAFLISI